MARGVEARSIKWTAHDVVMNTVPKRAALTSVSASRRVRLRRASTASSSSTTATGCIRIRAAHQSVRRQPKHLQRRSHGQGLMPGPAA